MVYTTITDRNEVRIIKLLIRDVSFHNYEEVFKKIRNAISDEESRIVLDMQMVEFMDSLSIGMLVPMLLYAKRMDGNLVVANLKKEIRELFTMLRLDKIIRVYDNVDDAMRSFD